MSDDLKPPAPAPLEPLPDAPSAPEKRTHAVVDDRMWGGPQYVDGLPGRPFVETKKQYFELLHDAGLRMKHQQESATGPAPRELTLPPALPEVVVLPMTQQEAQVFGAILAVLRHYDLIETIWCDDCAARDRPAGCRMQATEKRVLLECRCGHAIYTPPVGTTDLVLSKLPTIARTLADQTSGTVMTDAGPVLRPTAVLHDIEALLLRRYFAVLHARHKQPRLFHRWCFAGNPLDEGNALAIGSSPERMVLVCNCRTLYHQSRRVVTRQLRVM